MEKLVLERNPGEPLRITLTTELGCNATLVITRLLPVSADVGQMQVLQLQADLLHDAKKALDHRLQHLREMDGVAGPQQP